MVVPGTRDEPARASRRGGRRALPGGAVTFVFTDIEGSTRLVKALRDRYAEVLAGHRRLVRAAIAAHGGHEVDTQGDAFFAAFGGAKQAVLCALEVQRALAAQDWPGGAQVRVRIGVHTGHAVPAGGGYTGLAVHRAARICAVARGGQVLVSQPTRDLIEDEEEGEGLGFALVDAGEVRLKDLDRPVRLFQLAGAELDPPAPSGGTSACEVWLLGPVQVVRAGRELRLGGPRPRAVLALLVLEAGRVVPAGRLVEEVWRGSPPPGAAKTLRSYVSRLRAVLNPGATLVAGGGGYVLRLDPDLVDAVRFERLVGAGQAVLAGGEAAAAAGRFRQALGLWRGRALADVCEVEPLAREAARLEELRLVAVEGRIEADIAVGLHAEVTGELEGLVAEYPLRERLWRLLVLALYRAERQADALAAYRRARDMLADELGLEPGEELRRLEQAVLRQEVPAASLPARHNLPAPLTSFLGREQDLARLEGLLGEVRLVTLTGTGGTGKTRLALETGARVVGRFPDGVWLAELAGIADPGLVAGQVMGALGVRQAGDVPVLEALIWRLRSAELLLILDNCEHLLDACAQLAGALLRAAPGLRVLATSREPLGIAGEVTCPVRPLDLPPQTAHAREAGQAAAVRLFLDRGSAARGGTAGGVAPVAVAERICRKLDGLPLAIELAAARLGTLSAAEIEARLADRFRFLAYRRPAANPRHQALRAAMDWSYDLLSATERRVLGELSVFAGTFGLAQAAEVCGGGDQVDAWEVIDRLAGKSLVVAEPADDGTRYRLLDTVRHYAAGRLAEAGGTEAARDRHAAAFVGLAERERTLAVLVREQDNFRAALEWSLEHGSQAGPRLAQALGGFWLGRGLLAEGRDWLGRAVAQRPAGLRLRADLLRLLGAVLFEGGDLDRADTVLAEGAQVAAAAGTPAVQARIAVLRADIANLQGTGNAEALAECEAAAAVLESENDLDGLAEALTAAGRLRFWLGDIPASHVVLERAITCARQSGNRRTQMRASHWLAVTFSLLAIPADTGVARTEQLLQDASGDPWAEADLLKPLCVLYAHVGRSADARAAIDRSQSIFAGFGAKLALAESAVPAAIVGLIIGDPAAAERYARQGYEACRAMGERGGYVVDLAVLLADALYEQGRFDEAQQLIDQANTEPSHATVSTPLLTEAKLLAHRGQFAAARQLVGQAEALLAPTSLPYLQTDALKTRAEVERLAGAPGQAAASLRAALQIFEDLRAATLAGRTRAALTSLGAQPGPEPA
ncbi:MAG TPA: BTAD domain-containing putative transcriptional regulator [Streptosporangiaceae bacterium]